jgi:hypothetical protein
MAELRKIDFTKKVFECEGRKFYVKDSLSFARYRALQKINLEFGYSATFYDTFKRIREAYDLLNQVKLGDAAVVLHNVIYGVVSLEEKYDPALRICALFIDEENEDPVIYDEAVMHEKIECWGRELDVAPFLQWASNLVPGWIDAYKNVIPDTSKEEKKNDT